MGAWGSGPFENDDAADWSDQLTDGGGPEVVSEALRAVLGTTAPRAHAASSAVGAAAIVAAGLGVSGVELPEDLSDWLAGIDAATWPPLAAEAVRALDRVLEDSELADLWGEGDDGVWRDETLALRAELANPA